MRTVLRIFSVLAILSIFALAACGQNLDQQETKTAATGNSAVVELFNEAFTPPSVTITAGGTVTWKNQATDSYSVTLDGQFDQVITTGQSFTHKFTAAGTYRVYDRLQGHGATMTVTVK